MNVDANTTNNDFLLSVNDALKETTTKMNQMIADGDQRLRNLIMLRNEYTMHLTKGEKFAKAGVPGIPIVLKDGDFRFDRMRLHTKLYTRSFFEAKPQGGTELVFTTQHRGGQGFQWYVMTWKINSGLLSIWATHWMIDRDSEAKRNNVYFTRGFSFTEINEGDDRTITRNTSIAKNLFGSWFKMHKVPDRHKRAVSQAVTHSLRFDAAKDKEEGWVTTTAQYGIFEMMYKFNDMLRVLDMGEHMAWYLNKHFKIFWSLRVLKAVWGKEWTTKKFDVDGILKELWYYPNTTHFLDKKRFDSIREDWDVIRLEYEDWIKKFRFPPHINAPQTDEQHLIHVDTDEKNDEQEE